MLVRVACESIAVGHLEELLTTVDFSEEDLIAFQENLRAADYMDNLHQALMGERVATVAAIRQDPLRIPDEDQAALAARLRRRLVL